MKFLETKLEDYIRACENVNLHPELEPVFGTMSDSLRCQNHLILYGPPGVGKYTQALNYIKKFSPTQLKYERKMNVNFQNKKQYSFRISDVHFEIDMGLLGCNAKLLWNEIYTHILDILSARSSHQGIVMCKNFHKVHSELLDTFYSYMQTLEHIGVDLAYVFITEQVSFLPSGILERCQVVPIRRPTKGLLSKCTGKKVGKGIDLRHIQNIKGLHLDDNCLNSPNTVVVNKIMDQLNHYKDIRFIALRDSLYDIFIYHLDLGDCLWDMMKSLIDAGRISPDSIVPLFYKLHTFYRYYNNNYRPIYHLEKFMLYLCSTINGI
jgi:hypothetical protein